MNYINFTHLGGLPFTQDRLKFLMDAYMASFDAIGRLCGDKTILFGVEVNGTNVSDGMIVVDGELIPFVGGNLGTQVIITETITSYVFANNSTNPVEYTRVATTGVAGDFPFAQLRRLTSLVNVWKKNDIREVYVDPGEYAAWLTKFDVNGFGTGDELGWRILSKQIPATAGKVMVNLDPADADFSLPGNVRGAKTHTLTLPQLPQFRPSGPIAPDGNNPGGLLYTRGGSSVGSWQGDLIGNNQPHNNLQPSFVIIKLIRL